VQDYAVTDAAVHDSQVFAELLDQTPGPDGKKRTAYADSAYRSQERERQLAEAGIESHPLTSRCHPLTSRCQQRKSNSVERVNIIKQQRH